jgi:hypothetical protein
MLHRTFSLTNAVVVVALLALGTVSAAPAGDKLTIPAFQHWYLVNSMIVTKDSPLSDTIGGLHHIYVNSSDPGDAEGLEEVRVYRRLGISGLGGRRSREAIGH